MACIYCIKNDINNKLYIGKTIYTIEHRFKEHLRDAYNQKCNSKLHRAILKYGKEYFYPVLIEECLDEEASEKEQYYIQLYDSVENGYNISYGGEGESKVDFSKIEFLFLQGYQIKEIAEITGYTRKTISTRLKSAGYVIPSTQNGNSPTNKGVGVHIRFEDLEFSSLTTLAEYLKENVDVFKDKKINTIIKGVSKNSKQGTKYCGYYFYRL